MMKLSGGPSAAPTKCTDRVFVRPPVKNQAIMRHVLREYNESCDIIFDAEKEYCSKLYGSDDDCQDRNRRSHWYWYAENAAHYSATVVEGAFTYYEFAEIGRTVCTVDAPTQDLPNCLAYTKSMWDDIPDWNVSNTAIYQK